MAGFNTKILKLDPLHPDFSMIQEACDLLRDGELIAFPTETVYGLGADATNSEAVKKIFSTKNRPADNPLIAHFASIEKLSPYVREIPDIAYELSKIFWPGPLTLVLKRTDLVSPLVTKGMDTIAVRVPAHQVALSLIEQSGIPIAAPSANLSGRPSPTRASHVLTDFEGEIPLILDGGSTSIGVESTVINLTSEQPTLLRPGGLTIEELLPILPDLVVPERTVETKQPMSPGMKYTHYSPDTELVLVPGGYNLTADQLDSQLAGKRNVVILCTNPNHVHKVDHILLGKTLLDVQINLFASLRLLDDREFDLGLFEGVPREFQGFTIMNRIEKAAHRVLRL